MTRFFLLFGLLAATAAAAQTPRPATPARRPAATAQPAPAPTIPNEATVQARADALTANMTQGLALTPAQAEKVRTINFNSVRNVETARLRYRQDPAKLKSYIDDIGLARLEQLKDVLSPNQFARYQQKREEKMGIPTVRGNQGNPAPGLGE